MNIASTLDSFFHPLEQAILGTYLGRTKELPARIRKLPVRAPVDPDEWNESKKGVAPLASHPDFADKLILENAVARICLGNVAHELPQWCGTDLKTGQPVLGRKQKREIDQPARILLSTHLFTINWANSAPGYSWPQRYTATKIPGFDVLMITASDDTPEVEGYCDYAIGHFPQKANHFQEAKRIITGYWQNKVDEYDQTRWEELFSNGAVDAATASAWADVVWPPVKTENTTVKR